MAYEFILLEKEEGIATITLNRPEKLNALTPEMRHEVAHAIMDADGDESVRVIVLTGAGRGFCAGLDVSPAPPGQERRPYDPIYDRQWLLLPPQALMRNRSENQSVPELLRAVSKPTICAQNGVMAGAGSGFALSCDIIVASDKASFLVATTRIGLILEFETSHLLPQRIGANKALELAYTNERIDAAEMLRIGLVNKVVPHAELMTSAREMAKKMFMIPPMSLMLVKNCIHKGADQARNTEAQRLFDMVCEAVLSKTEDQKEARASFWERRAPEYKGH